jgi:hypothetical protein
MRRKFVVHPGGQMASSLSCLGSLGLPHDEPFSVVVENRNP